MIIFLIGMYCDCHYMLSIKDRTTNTKTILDINYEILAHYGINIYV